MLPRPPRRPSTAARAEMMVKLDDLEKRLRALSTTVAERPAAAPSTPAPPSTPDPAIAELRRKVEALESRPALRAGSRPGTAGTQRGRAEPGPGTGDLVAEARDRHPAQRPAVARPGSVRSARPGQGAGRCRRQGAQRSERTRRRRAESPGRRQRLGRDRHCGPAECRPRLRPALRRRPQTAGAAGTERYQARRGCHGPAALCPVRRQSRAPLSRQPFRRWPRRPWPTMSPTIRSANG